MFGQDLGSKLLELSLTRARKRPEDQQADDAAANAEPPRLRIVPSEPRPNRTSAKHAEEGDAVGRTPLERTPLERTPLERTPRERTPLEKDRRHAPPGLPRPAGLDLARFERLGHDEYRSPGGVVIRTVLRADGTWDVADVAYDGEVRLEQLPDGRVRVTMGDLRFEYSGDFERKLRLSPI